MRRGSVPRLTPVHHTSFSRMRARGLRRGLARARWVGLLPPASSPRQTRRCLPIRPIARDRTQPRVPSCLSPGRTRDRQWPPAALRRFGMLVHNLRRIMSNPRNVLVANYGYAVNYVR